MGATFTLPGLLVSTDWLEANLGTPGLTIIDIRGYVKATDLGGGRQKADYLPARDEYDAGHIPGAIFVDWTVDIVDPNNPIKAQVAPPDRFSAAMSIRGIGDDAAVVCVDHTGGHFATRLWWTLHYYGHDNVAVLDGGQAKWEREGRRLSTDVPAPVGSSFTPRVRPGTRVGWNDVLGKIGAADTLIVDARDTTQYTGEVQRHTNGGHVPGAVNIPSKTLIRDDGTWRSVSDLQSVLSAGGIDDRKVVAYCNGGVTATAILFALAQTGNLNWANYDGSWNEWGERADLPNKLGVEP